MYFYGSNQEHCRFLGVLEHLHLNKLRYGPLGHAIHNKFQALEPSCSEEEEFEYFFIYTRIYLWFRHRTPRQRVILGLDLPLNRRGNDHATY